MKYADIKRKYKYTLTVGLCFLLLAIIGEISFLTSSARWMNSGLPGWWFGWSFLVFRYLNQANLVGYWIAEGILSYYDYFWILGGALQGVVLGGLLDFILFLKRRKPESRHRELKNPAKLAGRNLKQMFAITTGHGRV